MLQFAKQLSHFPNASAFFNESVEVFLLSLQKKAPKMAWKLRNNSKCFFVFHYFLRSLLCCWTSINWHKERCRAVETAKNDWFNRKQKVKQTRSDFQSKHRWTVIKWLKIVTRIVSRYLPLRANKLAHQIALVIGFDANEPWIIFNRFAKVFN